LSTKRALQYFVVNFVNIDNFEETNWRSLITNALPSFL